MAEAFGIDPESSEDKERYSLAPASLLSILDVFLKTKAKTSTSPSAPSSAPSSSTGPAPTSASAPAATSASDKARAEALKTKGNALMGQKLYDSAIEQYTQAIEVDANPVYFSNRAAAWGALGEHEKAVEDATRAIELDPKFAKGFSRLGWVALRRISHPPHLGHRLLHLLCFCGNIFVFVSECEMR
jgi:small glutamine-rich tetratricopeptide repeat-containing protein alpha